MVKEALKKKEKKVKKMEEKRRKTAKKEHAQRGKLHKNFPDQKSPLCSFPRMAEKLFEKQQEGSPAEENSQEAENVRKRKGEEDQSQE